MTRAFHVEETIDRPAEQVWEQLTRWEKAHEWMAGVESLRADGKTAVGTKITFRARGRDRDSEIVALRPGRSITLRSIQGGVTADYTYAVVPDGNRSRVTLDAECRTQGLLWRLSGPLLRLLIRWSDNGQLAAFKQRLES